MYTLYIKYNVYIHTYVPLNVHENKFSEWLAVSLFIKELLVIIQQMMSIVWK